MDTKVRFTAMHGLATLAILLAATLSTGCGISKAQYLGVTRSRDELAAQNQKLSADLDATNKDKAQLESSKAALESRVKSMEAAVAQQQKSSEDVKNTYDTLIARLQGELSSGKVEIEQVRDGISVNLAQDILFRSGSAKLDPTGRELLLKVAEELKTSPFEVLVNGHTDDQKIGAALASRYPTNWELGGARASRIVRLFEEVGVSKQRMAAISFSDSRPRESNDSPDGRARNRRIEIRLRPTASEPTAAE